MAPDPFSGSDDEPLDDDGFLDDGGLDGEDVPPLPSSLASRVSPERWESMDPEDRALLLDVQKSNESDRMTQLARAMASANGGTSEPEPDDEPEAVAVGHFKNYTDDQLRQALANALSAPQKVLLADEDTRDEAIEAMRQADPSLIVQIVEDLVARAANGAETRATKKFREELTQKEQAAQAESRLARSITSACGHDEKVLKEGHPVRVRAEKLLEDARRQTGTKERPTPMAVYQAFRQAYSEMKSGSRGQRSGRDDAIQRVAQESASRERAYKKAMRAGNEAEANRIAIEQMLAGR